MSVCSSLLCCWKRAFALNNVFSWKNSVSLLSASFCTSKPNLPLIPGISRLPTFAFQSPMMKRASFFFDIHSRRSCRSSQNHSTSASLALIVGTQTWITMILNGLPLKQTEVIVLFLRLHPGTAFWTVQLTMIAIPFLLRDSCPQQQIEQLYKLNSPIPVHFSSLIPKMSVFILSFPV